MSALAALLALAAVAPPAPADSVVSPEVHPDGRVTLRLRAPKAAAVTVAGEWSSPPNKPEVLTRDAAGVWSITVGPVEPNIYIYQFTVDGMAITDPVNPLVKLRARGSASMVEVPGGKPWEYRDVPHGTLETLTQSSPVLEGAMRQVVVYTPPGYGKSPSARYPLLFLLHGNNDLAVGWTMAGRANLILDNLIAEKKVTPMIVVMPWGHALPFGVQAGNNDLFERYLLADVMPLVKGRYRVAAGRRNQAIVGLSMGGAQALQIGLGHRDQFSAIGVFGSGMLRADFEARFGKTQGPPIAPFFVGVGKEDGALPKAKELVEGLRAHGLPTTYQEVDGGHTYPVWRKLLVETAPLLFKR